MLLVLWALAAMGVPLALSSPGYWLLEFLITPILALATLVAVTPPPDLEVYLRRRWRGIYFAMMGAVAASGLVGMVAVAGDLATAKFANGPIAILFLLAFVTGWRAISTPTPRRAAVPAAVIHAFWIPLLIMDLGCRDDHLSALQERVALDAGIGMLAASAVAAIVSLVAFGHAVRTEIPSATARR